MNLPSTLRATGLGLSLALVFATGALAEDSNSVPPGQQPPTEQQEPAPQQKPAPDPAKCVTNETDFKRAGDKAVFVIALTNACESRQSCTVSAYVVTAGGPSQGKATLLLAPASEGKAAQQSYALPVEGMGGMANVSQSCTTL